MVSVMSYPPAYQSSNAQFSLVHDNTNNVFMPRRQSNNII